MDSFDRHEATAQARVDRLVDQVEASADRVEAAEERSDESFAVGERELADGMQIRADDDELPTEVDTWTPVRDDDLVDALVEAFNARDLEGLAELSAPGCEVLGLSSGLRDLDPAIGDLWDRRPSVLLTRAVDDDRALGVLWERAATQTWAPVGVAHVDGDDEVLQVLEFSDDLGLIERLAPAAPDADDDALWADPDGLDDQPS